MDTDADGRKDLVVADFHLLEHLTITDYQA